MSKRETSPAFVPTEKILLSINKTFVIDEADYIKIKITGLSDQYPIDAVLEDMYIALDNSNYNQLTENIIFQNGYMDQSRED